MSGPINTINTLPPQVQQYANDLLLARKRPFCIHSLFSMKKQHPIGAGNIHRFRRYNNLPTVPVPVGPSGLTGPALPLSAINIDAQLQWYNGYVTLTDQVSLISQEDVLAETADLLNQCLRETEDELVRNALLATSSFVNCAGGNNGDSPTEITAQDISSTVKILLNNSARTIMDVEEAADLFGTGPVRQAYMVLAHTDLSSDLENVQGFKAVSDYPSQQNVLRPEWGAVRNSRYLLSPLGSKSVGASGLGNTVYNCFFIGMESYSQIFLEGALAEFIYKPLGWGNDPTNLRQSAGFKFAMAQRVLNDGWLINQRCTLA